MKYLNKATFGSQLKRRYPDHNGGWFYNGLEDAFGCPCLNVSPNVKLETLIKRTQTMPLILGSSFPLIAFPNGGAGWRGTNRNRKQSPILIEDSKELGELLRARIYFRDAKRYEDNYHVASSDLNWFVVFCHHGDLHVFADARSLRRVRAAWKMKTQHPGRTRRR